MDRKNILIQLKPYSVVEYILRLFVVIVIMFFCFITIGFNSSPLSGFISSSVVFLLITITASFILLRNSKWIWFFVFAYLIHLGIGFLHYLYFIDSSYFSTNGLNLPLPQDFTAPLDALKEIVSEKNNNGLFHYTNYYIGHPEIWNLISYPFYYFGVYILNIVPLNSFMSVFTSINILLISKQILRYKLFDLKKITILSVYFPLTLISSIFYRDVSGIAFMSLGLVLITFSKGKSYYYLMLFITLYLFYLQRTIYPLVLLLAIMIDFFNTEKRRLTLEKRILYFVIFIPVSVIMLRLSYDLGLAEGNNSAYIEGAVNVNYVFLPLKLIMGLVGPFPWTQYFSTGRIVYSYQFADYLQGALNITFIFLIIKSKQLFFQKKQLNILNLTGFFLIISGLATANMHSSYVSIGILFLIPWVVVNSPSWFVFKRVYSRTFTFMLVLSILIFTFFGSLGLGSLWK